MIPHVKRLDSATKQRLLTAVDPVKIIIDAEHIYKFTRNQLCKISNVFNNMITNGKDNIIDLTKHNYDSKYFDMLNEYIIDEWATDPNVINCFVGTHIADYNNIYNCYYDRKIYLTLDILVFYDLCCIYDIDVKNIYNQICVELNNEADVAVICSLFDIIYRKHLYKDFTRILWNKLKDIYVIMLFAKGYDIMTLRRYNVCIWKYFDNVDNDDERQRYSSICCKHKKLECVSDELAAFHSLLSCMSADGKCDFSDATNSNILKNSNIKVNPIINSKCGIVTCCKCVHLGDYNDVINTIRKNYKGSGLYPELYKFIYKHFKRLSKDVIVRLYMYYMNHSNNS